MAILSLALPFNLSADTACFRLPGRVFFASDLEEIHSSLDILNCVKGKPFVNSFTESNLTQLPPFKMDKLIEASFAGSQEKVKAEILPYVYIEKLKLTAVGRGRGKLSSVELARLGESCRKLLWENLENEEKALLISEVFLRERFSNEEDVERALLEYRKSLDVKDQHEFFSLKSPERKEPMPAQKDAPKK